jgi:hypothetical protein
MRVFAIFASRRATGIAIERLLHTLQDSPIQRSFPAILLAHNG